MDWPKFFEQVRAEPGKAARTLDFFFLALRSACPNKTTGPVMKNEKLSWSSWVPIPFPVQHKDPASSYYSRKRHSNIGSVFDW